MIKSKTLSFLSFELILLCESCLENKMTKGPFRAKGNHTTQLLELIYTNVCSLISIQGRGRYEYFVTFIDNYSLYEYIYLMHKKSEVFAKF